MSTLLFSAVLAAVAAGIPDVFAAAALSRAPVGRVLQTIASGILGETSYARGSTSVMLGLGLQIAMSFVIAVVYNIGSFCVTEIHRNPLIFGALHGVLIFVVMNFVVVPLSRAYPQPRWDPKSFVAMLIVMILFGEVISFIAAALSA
jgi:uncharacterized membrane protein YagU involved in acid resistance